MECKLKRKMKVKLNPNKIHMNESIDFTLGKEYFVIGISYGLWQVIGNNIARPLVLRIVLKMR